MDQMLHSSFAFTFMKTHADQFNKKKMYELKWFIPFNDLSPVRCNVRYVVKESIQIKNNNEPKWKAKRIDFLPVYPGPSTFFLLHGNLVFRSSDFNTVKFCFGLLLKVAVATSKHPNIRNMIFYYWFFFGCCSSATQCVDFFSLVHLDRHFFCC